MVDRKKARKISAYIAFVVIAVSAALCLFRAIPIAPESSARSEGAALQLLEEQPIDDTHDAFLVDTGGKYGILLVTVEMLAESFSDDFDFRLHFTVWDPKDRDAPLQVMDAGSGVFHWSEAVDANFDGYQDFGYMYAMGNQPQYWHFWLWDEAEGQFREEPEFDRISCPEFHVETKTIRGWNRSGAMGTGEETIHQWIGGKLVCVRRICMDWNRQNDCFELVVEDWTDNGLVEVYSKAFPADSTEHLDVSMKWCDMDYHGEP